MTTSELEEWVYQKREYLATKVRTAFFYMAQQQASQNHFDKAAIMPLKPMKHPMHQNLS